MSVMRPKLVNFLDSRFISIHKRNKESVNFESSNSEIALRLLWCRQKLRSMRPWGTMYELCYVVNWPVHNNGQCDPARQNAPPLVSCFEAMQLYELKIQTLITHFQNPRLWGMLVMKQEPNGKKVVLFMYYQSMVVCSWVLVLVQSGCFISH